ncbi:GDSL esterase/lipase At5g55050-like [Wolffia australiana]
MGFLLLAVVVTCTLFSGTTASADVPAIYAFGDSSVDVGNNKFLRGNKSNENFLPYGIDFPGSRPTGRFSNGYIGIDYFAKELGFKKSPPASLSRINNAKARHGLNFASGGSGILDITSGETSVSLNKQISYFRRTAHQLRSRLGANASDRYVSKSIFFLSIGSNDLFYFAGKFGLKNATEQHTFIQCLSQHFRTQLTTLYTIGARKFVVIGTSLIGCVPIARLIEPGGQCIEPLNIISRNFSIATRMALQDLASRLKGFSYSFVDVYAADFRLASNPQKFGFGNISSACCGSGRFNTEVPCGPNASYCSNRDNYVFWDSVHPSQASYKLLIQTVYRAQRYTTPITIKRLVRL